MPDPDLEVRRGPGHPDPYDKGGGSQKNFFSPSAPCILDSSHPLSHPFPFDYNYTCRRVKWNTGTMQLWHPFLNNQQQDHLSPRCALGSNLLRTKGDWVQVLKPAPLQLRNWLCFSPTLPSLTFYGLLSRPPRGSAIHVFLVYKWSQAQVQFVSKMLKEISCVYELQHSNFDFKLTSDAKIQPVFTGWIGSCFWLFSP